ncbi:MAG: AAA family ATPase, partial [Rhodoferax sp.]|nr:AAA family ATPase [Rhodoferax sp.]
MILSILINHFRSCKEVLIENMGGMVALVGRNGAGKTNILKAIEWAAHIGAGKRSLETERLHRPGSVILRIQIDQQIFRYSVERRHDGQKSVNGLRNISYSKYLTESLFLESATGERTRIFECTNGVLLVGDGTSKASIGPLTPASQSIISLFPKHAITPLVKQFMEYIESIRYYPIEETEEIEEEQKMDFISHDDYLDWVNTPSVPINSNRRIIFKLLDLFLNRTEDFRDLENLLGVYGLGVLYQISVYPFDLPGESIQSNNPPNTRKYYSLQFVPNGIPSGCDNEFSSLSFGTKRMVWLITSIIYDKASVSMIEQPEDGIHTGLLQKLIPLLRSYSNPRQFIITSHSTEVMNRLKPDEVRLVSLVEGSSEVRALSSRELETAAN